VYLTVEETAEYLSLPVSYIEALIQQRRIRAVHDGDQYLINKEQFNRHLEQLEKYKKQLEEGNEETLLEDWDVKDED